MKQVIRCLAMLCVLLPGCDSSNKDANAQVKTEGKAATPDGKQAAPGTEVRAPADAKPAPVAGKTETPTAAAGVATPREEQPTTTTIKAEPGSIPPDSTGRKPTTDAGNKVEVVERAPTEAPAEDGLSLVQREGWANYAKELQRKETAVNTACGSKINASYDKTTYKNFDPMKDRTQSACEQSFGTLSSVCNTPEGKAAVQKLTRATCKFSTTGTGVSLSGTTLIVKIDPANSSISGKSPGGYSWISAIKEVL